MTTLSDAVAEAVRLRDAATKGPYQVNGLAIEAGYATSRGKYKRIVFVVRRQGDKEQNDADAALIAAAPQLVDLIERLHSELVKYVGIDSANVQYQIHQGNEMQALQEENARLHARVRELMADAVFAASTKKHHGVLMEENERLRAELLLARAEIESWKRQSRANWEAARELTTHALKP